MESENRHEFDVTLGTFDHPRYEIIATGEVHDGPDEVMRGGSPAGPADGVGELTPRPAPAKDCAGDRDWMVQHGRQAPLQSLTVSAACSATCLPRSIASWPVSLALSLT
jgi:hypothetical protein